MSDPTESQESAPDAHTVRLTIDPDAEDVRERCSDAGFERYLRRAHDGAVAAGDCWNEFVSDGCGLRTDVTICVRAVEGGSRIGPRTTFEWE